MTSKEERAATRKVIWDGAFLAACEDIDQATTHEERAERIVTALRVLFACRHELYRRRQHGSWQARDAEVHASYLGDVLSGYLVRWYPPIVRQRLYRALYLSHDEWYRSRPHRERRRRVD